MKKIIKGIFKFFLFILLFIVLFIGIYLLAAWGLSQKRTTPDSVDCDKKQLVFINTNGIHLDIIIPQKLLRPELAQQLGHQRKFVSFGWGDEDFYLNVPTWDKLKAYTVVNAAFLPSNTLMHVEYYKEIRPKWRPLPLCMEQLDSLQDFIQASFATNKKGKLIELTNTGYWINDYFYKAKGSYTCFYTCNTWVNEALKKASVPTATWSPHDKWILQHLPVAEE